MSHDAPADGPPAVDAAAAPPASPEHPTPARSEGLPPEDDAPPPMDGSGPQELDVDEL